MPVGAVSGMVLCLRRPGSRHGGCDEKRRWRLLERLHGAGKPPVSVWTAAQCLRARWMLLLIAVWINEHGTFQSLSSFTIVDWYWWDMCEQRYNKWIVTRHHRLPAVFFCRKSCARRCGDPRCWTSRLRTSCVSAAATRTNSRSSQGIPWAPTASTKVHDYVHVCCLWRHGTLPAA